MTRTLRRTMLPTGLLALLFLMSLGISGSAAPGSPGTLPTSELRRGMKGYGLTVFEGTRITRFPITILGIARGYLSGSDLVLIRVDAGYLVDHGIGIVAGMSGSPIYVQDRLVGALSYGWGYSKEPIGGVTPIQSMMAELPGSLHPAPAVAPWGTPGRLEEAVTVGQHTWGEVRIEPRPSAGSDHALVLSPITTLLQTSGLDPRSLERLNRSLEPLPLRAVQGFQGPRQRGGIPPMVPGSAVGVPLLTGDIEIAATGTLTWRQGDAILAFGHPLAEFGEVRLPLSAAHIHTVLPSYQLSFKMASQLGVIGEMTRDRLWAIGGRLHAPVPMIPVRLEVDDPTRGSRRTWNVRAAQHRFLTASILGSATSYATGCMSASRQAATASLKVKVQPVGLPALEISDLVAGPDLADQAAGRVDHLLRRLVDNPFEPVLLQSVHIQARVVPEPRRADVERIYTDRSLYLPGQTVRLGIVLKPYGQTARVREVEIPLPRDCQPGKVRIGVSSREALPELLRAMNLEEPQPTDLASLLENMQREERGPDLALRTLLPGEGLQIGARSLPLLPAAWRQALATSNQSNLTKGREILRQGLTTPWVLKGKALLEVEVRAPEAPAPPSAEAAPASPAIADLPGFGRSWTIRGRSPGGEFLGAALDAAGAITVGPAAERLYQSSDAAPCSLARQADGGLLVGLLGSGEILRLVPGRPAEVFARTGAAAVLSLASGPDGVWAGTAADGTLLHWDTGGKQPQRVRLPATYVWALLPAPDGGVYAATGLPGSLVRVEASGLVHHLWSAGAPHVRAMAALPDGRLLLALSTEGRLVRLDPTTGRTETLFQSPSSEIEAVAISGPAVWLAAGQTLYRLSGEGNPAHPVQTGPALCLAGDGAGGVWAGLADGTVARVPARGQPLWLPASTGRPVLALLPEAGGVLAARAFPVEILRLGSGLGPGQYLSPVLDAGRPSRWGQIRWLEIPGATGPVQVSTRSGSNPEPDAAWSSWSPPLSAAQGRQVESPPARFLQVRVGLVPGNPASPRIESLQVGFTALPGLPTVAWISPLGAERWSGEQTLKWRLVEGDPAAVSYDVELSGDGGSTWTPLARNRPGSSREETMSLPTSQFRDGVYLARVAAWDRLEPEKTRVETLTGALLLANSKARVSWLPSRRPGHPCGLAEVQVAAITEIHYRRQHSDAWKPARPRDGLFDSNREEFELDPGELTKLEVRVKDEAGNQTLVTARPPEGLTAGEDP